MTEMADRILMAGKALDEIESERFTTLIEQNASLVYAIALSILRNHADAEDAAQDCFLRLIRYRYRLAFAVDKRAFVARVAQRCALDRIRQRPAEQPLEEDEEFFARDGDAASIDDAHALAQLGSAIRSLPEELRRVVELQQSGELTSEQIGRVLRIPAATVRSRMARAKTMLRQKLERRLPDGGTKR